MGRRGVTMHCLNPDRVVMRGDVREACAGALADLYEALGGSVAWYGKPYEAIYAHALRRAGDPPPMKCSPSATACRPTCSEPRARVRCGLRHRRNPRGRAIPRRFRRRQRAWRLGAHRGGRGASLTGSGRSRLRHLRRSCHKSGRRDWSRKPPFENGVDGSYRRFHRRNLEAPGTGLLDRTDQLPGAQVIPEFL